MKIKKLVSFLCVLSVLAALFAIPLQASAQTEEDLRNKLNNLENQYKETQKQLNSIEAEQKKEQDYKDLLDKQLYTTSQQIDLLEASISNLNSDIKALETQISSKQKEIDDSYELLKKRIRAIYVLGSTSNLEYLLNSDGYSDFLARSETVKSITRHDKALMDKMAEDKKAIEDKKKSVEDKKAQVAQDKNALDSKQKTLENQSDESEEYLAALKSDTKAYQAQMAKYKKDMEAAEHALDEFMKNYQTDQIYDGKGFAWPVPSISRVSSPYGDRPSFGGFHGGMDISNGHSYGAPIVASAGGTVILAQRWDGHTKDGMQSYGNCVMIDHGKGADGKTYVTLYAHCSTINVSVGQTVKQGQQIGKIGETGNAYGAHLHFEMRVNNKRVNPAGYVKYK